MRMGSMPPRKGHPMNRSHLLFAVLAPSFALACSGSAAPAPDIGTGSDSIVAAPTNPESSSAPVTKLPVGAGQACGNTTCGEGTVCCNASCGICTPPGMMCTQQVCEPEPPSPGKPCIRTGCSGQVCADEDIATTCEWKPEYACFKDAICERNAAGTCGWRETPELKKCLSSAQ
jgi:hypothetical protein